MKKTLVLIALTLVSCGQVDETPQPDPIDYKAEWAKKVEQFEREFKPQRDSIKQFVSQCSEQAERGREYQVNYNSLDVCKKFEIYMGTPVKYTIARDEDGRARINLNLGAVIKSPSGRVRELEILKIFQSCSPHTKTLFDRYGIIFNLNIEEKVDGKEYDNLVTFEDSDDAPMNAHNWRISPRTHGDHTPETCGVVYHEVGHLLGLVDEYRSPQCPDRIFIDEGTSPHSIMHGGGNFENADYFPRHIQVITRPLCEDLATSQSWTSYHIL